VLSGNEQRHFPRVRSLTELRGLLASPEMISLGPPGAKLTFELESLCGRGQFSQYEAASEIGGRREESTLFGKTILLSVPNFDPMFFSMIWQVGGLDCSSMQPNEIVRN
jgi:hypothetical protein